MDDKAASVTRRLRAFTVFSVTAASAALLTGCTWLPVTPTLTASQRQARLTQQALIDDEAGEDLQNQLNLLNIVRAYEHRPRYYVDVSSWNQAIPTLSASATRDWHLNSPALGNSETLGLQSDTSTATISPLTAQKFIRGITTQETPENVVYFANQGYPTSLLLHLFVRSISVYDADDVLKDVYTNDPMDAKSYARFDAVANGLAGCRLAAADDDPDTSEPIGPPIVIRDASNLRWQDYMVSKGYVLAPAPASVAAPLLAMLATTGAGETRTTGKEPQPEGARNGTAALPAAYYLVKAPSSHLTLKLGISPKANMYCQSARAEMNLPPLSANPAKAPKKNAWYMKMELRSPEAVFYYLGEVTREQLDGPDDKSGKKALGILMFSDSKSCGVSDGGPCMPACVDLFAISSSKAPAPPSDYHTDACHRPAHFVDPVSNQRLATDPDPLAGNIAYTAPAADEGSLSVDYGNATYTMSWDYHHYDITLVAFTIAELIIGMQTDATELQKTPLVQAVQ